MISFVLSVREAEMAVTYSALAQLWGAEHLVHFPVEQFAADMRFDAELLPPGAALPDDVPILFTVDVAGPIELFNLVEFQVGEDEPLRLVVLGGSPDDPNLLFALDMATGVVALLDPSGPGLELVNSTFALFVEFLYRLARFISADPGGTARAEQANVLRDELITTDPSAFSDPESWWSMAFGQLTA
jgi:hypothetical protein